MDTPSLAATSPRVILAPFITIADARMCLLRSQFPATSMFMIDPRLGSEATWDVMHCPWFMAVVTQYHYASS